MPTTNDIWVTYPSNVLSEQEKQNIQTIRNNPKLTAYAWAAYNASQKALMEATDGNRYRHQISFLKKQRVVELLSNSL